jgi:hypothetical protein
MSNSISTPIDFPAAFKEAEVTTPFDKLLHTLAMATKSVKAERDRLTKDAESAEKFKLAVDKLSGLSTKLSDPDLIPDYMEAAREMGRANTSRLGRIEKSIPQWDIINECFSHSQGLMFSLIEQFEDETETKLALAS